MKACAAYVTALLLVSACARRPAPLISEHREPIASGTRLTLIPAPGARINARLVPALERKEGVLRFHGESYTADSNYFTSPPMLEVSGDPSGLIRASVCAEGESVCRPVVVKVPL